MFSYTHTAFSGLQLCYDARSRNGSVGRQAFSNCNGNPAQVGLFVVAHRLLRSRQRFRQFDFDTQVPAPG